METIRESIEWGWPYIVASWPWLKSILIGYGASIGLTQVLKFYIPGELTDKTHQRRTRLLAAFLAFLFIYITWPDGDALLWATALGAMCPMVVKGAMLALYHYYPYLKPKLSAGK